VSLLEHSITIQVGDERGGLLAWDSLWDNLSTNPGRHRSIAPPAAPTSLNQYIHLTPEPSYE